MPTVSPARSSVRSKMVCAAAAPELEPVRRLNCHGWMPSFHDDRTNAASAPWRALTISRAGKCRQAGNASSRGSATAIGAAPSAPVFPSHRTRPRQSRTATAAPATGRAWSSVVTQASDDSRPHLKMHAEVGDERGRLHVVGRVLAMQRSAEPRARQLDDVEAGPLERDAHDLERAHAAGPGDRYRPRGDRRAVEDRQLALARIVPAVAAAHLAVLDLVQTREPLDDRAVVLDRRDAAGNGLVRGGDATRHRGLEIAQGNRQHCACVQLDDPEARRELRERRGLVGRGREREARRVRELPAGIVLQAGGQLDPELRALGQRRREGNRVDEGRVAFRQSRLVGRAILGAEHDPRGLGAGDRRAKPELHRQDRDARRLRVHARAA